MNKSPFQDPRANDLLSRVSEDVSLLRQDIGQLFSHTTRHTLPMGARGLADTARNRLAAGRIYTAEQLRALRNHVGEPTSHRMGRWRGRRRTRSPPESICSANAIAAARPAR